MKALKNHNATMVAYKKKIDALNKKLIEKIEALPENHRITVINPQCFTISMAGMGVENWTFFYHCFTRQYKFLRAIIENYNISAVEKTINQILTRGTYRLSRKLTTTDGFVFDGGVTYKFHPDVIEMLKEILE